MDAINLISRVYFEKVVFKTSTLKYPWQYSCVYKHINLPFSSTWGEGRCFVLFCFLYERPVQEAVTILSFICKNCR